MLYRKRHRSRLETTRPSKDRNFLPLFRKKRRQILSTCSSKKLSLSWKPASRTAAIKLLEGNDRSSFYSDTSPPYAPSIYTYIYIGTRCPSKRVESARSDSTLDQWCAIVQFYRDRRAKGTVLTNLTAMQVANFIERATKRGTSWRDSPHHRSRYSARISTDLFR